MSRDMAWFVGAWAAIGYGLCLLPYQVGGPVVLAAAASLYWRKRRKRPTTTTGERA